MASSECATASFIEYLKGAVSTTETIEFMRESRRHIHENPELMFEENETSKYIKSRLLELGIKYTEGWGIDSSSGLGGTGIIADLGTGESPCVAIRADIDALPIHETTCEAFKSKKDGVMHACGHDTHVAMLLGAAKVLKERESEIQGTVRLIFQPAEEGGGGALMMVREGIFEVHPRVERVFGLHNTPGMVRGVHGRGGGMMAGSLDFEGIIYGKGGHAAQPHKCVDPLQALAALITSSQTIVSRNLDPVSCGVLSITSVSAAHTTNVIAEKVTFGGTIRTFTNENAEMMWTRLQEMAESIAKAYGCPKIELKEHMVSYPPVVNDPKVWEEVKKDLGFINEKYTPPSSGPAELFEAPLRMGAEDFAFYLKERPGVFFRLGNGLEEEFSHPLHSPSFKFNEDVMPEGALLLSSAAITQLKRLTDANKAAQ